jgi:DMSO reductase anchor subunit
MHPAYSIIVFTVASGAGFGLLAWLALLGLLGALPFAPGLAVAGLALGLALVTAGLAASTLHLGRPERAWRALSQWRTSWLSREGVMALATYPPACLLALGWLLRAEGGLAMNVCALITLVCALATLTATGMIYASLRTIRQWYQPLTMPVYVALGLASGALLLNLLIATTGRSTAFPVLCAVLLACGAALKWAYWTRIDGELRTFTAKAATGLGGLGAVRVLEAPHTQPNFIMREMGYSVARKHAVLLRRLSLLFAFLLPFAVLLAPPAGGAPSAIAALLAALSMAVGLTIERWLFFAEAEHVAMLYYGRDAA